MRTNDKSAKQLKWMYVFWEEKLHGSVHDEIPKTEGSGPHYHFKQCLSCSR
jgi:hypothetical protein